MPTGIYNHKNHPTIFREGHKPWNTGSEGIVKPNSGNFKKGQKPWISGKKHSDKTKIKMSLHSAMKDKIGNKHPNWKGGYDRKLYLNERRRIRKLGNGGFHTFGEWENLKAQYNWTCPSCKRKEPEIKLTEDHIVSINNGGSDNIENIQPLCRSCNCKKRTKTIKYGI